MFRISARISIGLTLLLLATMAHASHPIVHSPLPNQEIHASDRDGTIFLVPLSAWADKQGASEWHPAAKASPGWSVSIVDSSGESIASPKIGHSAKDGPIATIRLIRDTEWV